MYTTLKSMILQFINEKFGGPIINIEGNEKFIIVKKNNEYFKNIINFKEKMDITNSEILNIDKIKNGIDYQNIEIIEKNFINMNVKNNDLSENINENIGNIKKNNKKLNEILNCKEKKQDKYYCKQFSKYSKTNSLIKMYQMILWYIKIFDELENKDEIKKYLIFKNYIKNV